MPYHVELSRQARKALHAIAKRDRRRIVARLEKLGRDPRPPDAKKLTSSDDLMRIRVGDYRVVYQVRDDRLLVLVIRIGHRRDIYRQGQLANRGRVVGPGSGVRAVMFVWNRTDVPGRSYWDAAVGSGEKEHRAAYADRVGLAWA